VSTVFTEGQVLWSLRDVALADGFVDETGEWQPLGTTRVNLCWRVWTVEKTTPRGAWVVGGRAGDTLRGERVWVAHGTRMVSATMAEAKARAVEKRAWHVKECRKRLERAEQQLHTLENLKVDTVEQGAVT
jgi:hypothetical protein